MIKINNTFSYETDRYNWILYEFYTGKDKNNNDAKYFYTTYHATLSQLLRTVLDKSLKKVECFDKIVDVSKSLSKDLELLK